MSYRVLLASIALDAVVGDPARLPHPVNAIAACAKSLESPLRTIADSPKEQVIAGGIMAVLTVSSSFVVTELLSRLGRGAQIALITSALAGNSLYRVGTKMNAALYQGIPQARQELSFYVGRSTEQLSESQICKATVETLAENTCDGYIAPLFWAVIGSLWGHGASFMWAYKAISTLDSLYGYTDEKNIYFGRLAARMDDVATYIPARVSAVCIALASVFVRENSCKAYHCIRDEHDHHESPNAGWSESAYAGALDLQLGGAAVYGDRVIDHPEINAKGKRAQQPDIRRAQKLFIASATCAAIGACSLLYLARKKR